jgi:two-component system response regulator HupR/HoxA
MKNKVLIVDPTPGTQVELASALSDEFDVLFSATAEASDALLCCHIPQAIVLHDSKPSQSIETQLEFFKRTRPSIPKLLISDVLEDEQARTLVERYGLSGFLPSAWSPVQLQLMLQQIVELHYVKNSNELLSHELLHSKVAEIEKLAFQTHQVRGPLKVDAIVAADDSPMQKTLCQLGKIAHYDVSLLITGESGTGKELLARAIHYNSPRADKPFVVENCGAMHEDLLCSELFGHRRGAFTGADSDHVGLFEKADGGTIFLDEIGETSPGFQVKLLRVLQEGEIRPLGSNVTKKVDVRVVAATNRNLKDEIEFRRFRADLFYRLATMQIEVLPLRRRRMDITPIAESLLRRLSDAFEKSGATFSKDTIRLLNYYDWPGNVRELENEVKRMLVLAGESVLTPELLSSHIQALAFNEDFLLKEHEDVPKDKFDLKEHVELLEKRLITRALIEQQWNKSQAANRLGLSRVGLASKIERYAIEKRNLELQA